MENIDTPISQLIQCLNRFEEKHVRSADLIILKEDFYKRISKEICIFESKDFTNKSLFLQEFNGIPVVVSFDLSTEKIKLVLYNKEEKYADS